MTEADLKRDLVDSLRRHLPRFVVIRHEDKFTAGVPDLSVTGNGRTTWWEVKFANPRTESRGVQDLIVKKLAHAGFAAYVVYSLQKGKRGTHVIYPDSYEDGMNPWLARGFHTSEFDHLWVASYIAGAHAR